VVAFADQDSVQMLQRSSQVGEFYRMSPPHVYDLKNNLPPTYMGKSNPANPSALHSIVQHVNVSLPLLRPLTDIMIYDEESDRHVHIPFADALTATCYGNGVVGDLFLLEYMSDESFSKFEKSKQAAMKEFALDEAMLTDAEVPAAIENWRELGRKARTDETDATARLVVGVVKFCVSYGIWLPVEIVIARPFIEHLMLSAIVCVAGRDTGATLFGPADMCATWNSNPNSSSIPLRSKL
tara:strand:- start:309 stop:1025 length:717 start_codon:yes stop_codon:yes gene_type:complete